jgi:glucosamine-6-phosphate deaminase
MRLVITKNVGLWSATYVKEKILKKHSDKFVLGLPTGGTAVALYKYLASFHNKGHLSFKDVITFNMDEYIGLAKEHEQSYWTFMHENLFNHIDIDPKNIHIPDGNAPNIKEFCVNYEKKIKEVGGINLFLGGVGENGHLAFNEPYSSLSSLTRDKELDRNTIAANSRFFGGDTSMVPKSAITVGTQTLLDSEEVLIMITGDKKSLALYNCVEGPVSHVWPISILQVHKKAIIVADEAATMELKVKTYNHFKELEDEFSYIEELL